MPVPIRYDEAALDKRARVLQSTTIVASPAAAAETIICQTPQLGDVGVLAGVLIFGYAAFVVGTSGTACRLRIRQTNVAGTVVADTDATTGGIAAAAKVDMNCNGFDTTIVAAGQVYVLTLQVTAGAAASTVAFTQLLAIPV